MTLNSTRRWWHARTWCDYGLNLMLYYGRHGRYTFRFDESVPTAYMNPATLEVVVGPRFPRGVARQVRFLQRGRQQRAAMLEAYVAHEAGHIRFSCRKPGGTLGNLWNYLEDERIERLMTRDDADLAQRFTMLGDVLAARNRKDYTGQTLEGCLAWRWEHDQPTPLWTPANPGEWAQVRPLVEEAWTAPTSEDVVRIARQILAVVQIPEQAEPDFFLEHVSAGGGGSAQREEQPGDDGSGPGGAGEQDGGSGLEGTPDGTGPGTQGDGAAQPGGPGPSGDPASGPDDTPAPPGPGSAGSGEGGDADDLGGPGGVSAAPRKPSAPALDPGDSDEADELLDEVEGAARQLAMALRPPTDPSLARPHASRGRYDYGRHVTGSERPFMHRQVPRRPGQADVRLLRDVSSSMEGARHSAARAADMMLHRACEAAGLPYTTVEFNDSHAVIVRPGDAPMVARQRITAVQCRGSTTMWPALNTALTLPADAGRQVLVLVLCDGELTAPDLERCKALVQEARAATVVPILIGEAVNPKVVQAYEAAFGRSLVVRDHQGLATELKSWLSAVYDRMLSA
ncbi:hypothetical protein [Deinococcus soli (ex Cha et al. 2016)]|uniref:Uncharacterized protein n=2 Tax=Deinococcus soli (ex Cha et al. 2016) TaxID=1309411 RepID=A0ACC6KGD6_9DEIO|nr:hypothetical protein [Deinococcus soli (ex Cha et al. 2016)]MDR6218197.1 hypothetical protein [Deinococcus soli (ex Cha et al. 2016)]MDR6328937.1 hypothetical protein [Deinococcus soli (ex Cha et al. 2016)]MDR6751575.1 hypothetical protein [Deinococcus soli (ex Cha et al. 2016)]